LGVAIEKYPKVRSQTTIEYVTLLDTINSDRKFKKLYIIKKIPIRLTLMNYPIPTTPEEIAALRQRPVDEEMIAAVIAGIIKMARSSGQSLDDLTEEVLAEDPLLDPAQRRWLSQLLTRAWENLSGWV
jgi:hypothetical protein